MRKIFTHCLHSEIVFSVFFFFFFLVNMLLFMDIRHGVVSKTCCEITWGQEELPDPTQ